MKEAAYYQKVGDNIVQCFLCPHNCKIANGYRGVCNIRKNENQKLIAETYNNICSIALDPIEKKPLYHFFPGKNILSIGNIGCNLTCNFCQNWEISQSCVEDFSYLKPVTINDIITKATKSQNNIGIAFTYNEPTVWFEFMLDIAKQSFSIGLKNVMVSNGFINQKPLVELCQYIDAFNIDLKAFSNDFYKYQTKASLYPILESLKTIRKNGNHLEITHLIIPGLNDNQNDFSKMIDWICNELGENTILHLSRYYPRFKSIQPPTPPETILDFYKIASVKMKYVYIGNLMTEVGRNTNCQNCGNLLIKRNGYQTEVIGLNEGKCSKCKQDLSQEIKAQ